MSYESSEVCGVHVPNSALFRVWSIPVSSRVRSYRGTYLSGKHGRILTSSLCQNKTGTSTSTVETEKDGRVVARVGYSSRPCNDDGGKVFTNFASERTTQTRLFEGPEITSPATV
jgi:hypothetical protein